MSVETKGELQVGTAKAVPGQKTQGWVPVNTSLDGGELRLPVHIVAGTKPGPTLCLTAAGHGDETESMATVIEIVQSTDPDELCGTIVAVPVANPPGVEHRTYYNPRDGMNLDFYAFPGNEHGYLTQQLAYALGSEIVAKDKIDYFVDVHSTPKSFPGLNMNYLYISPAEGEIARRSEEICLVQGYEIYYRGAPEVTPGSLVGWGIQQGIPSTYSNGSVQGVLNVMKHIGMIEGEPVLPDRQFITQNPRLALQPKHGGLIYSEFSLDEYPDQIVSKGTRLGTLVSPYSLEVIQEFVAPWDAAVIMWYEGVNPCHAGDYGFVLCTLEGAEWIRGSAS